MNPIRRTFNNNTENKIYVFITPYVDKVLKQRNVKWYILTEDAELLKCGISSSYHFATFDTGVVDYEKGHPEDTISKCFDKYPDGFEMIAVTDWIMEYKETFDVFCTPEFQRVKDKWFDKGDYYE